ncbi:hypothetical protein [uncultured Anaerococcus sp.]|uniref:hypothetical protein n=1 Tax=uncultured Anaerococcus sp. TaxID=293428 RepID=UPI00280B0F7B|nr:hypothetical protein [uncultured Anaerococcus sp.]MDU5149715.1 hypothetical protein [Anaerococcus prevotii]
MNGLEDYKKARQYLDWYIQELESDVNVGRQLSYLEDEMKQELTPEEEQEMYYLTRKMISTVLTMTHDDHVRYKELFEKKYGTSEDREEERRQNRKNFYKLQDKLSKKATK